MLLAYILNIQRVYEQVSLFCEPCSIIYLQRFDLLARTALIPLSCIQQIAVCQLGLAHRLQQCANGTKAKPSAITKSKNPPKLRN